MRIFINQKWQEGFLDYYRNPQEYRIKVLAWINLEKLEGVYFVRPKSFGLIFNYVREIGSLAVWRKIKSRLQEQRRNEKYVSCGIGIIIESADELKFPGGAQVGFIAPLHPAAVERVILPAELIFKIDQSALLKRDTETILYQPLIEPQQNLSGNWWFEIRGHNIYSGKVIDIVTQEKVIANAGEFLQKVDWTKARLLETQTSSNVAEVKKATISSEEKTTKKKGVLFGFGHYAKTNVLPNIARYIKVETIHEIDPTQMTYAKNIRLDTAPTLRQDERYDVFFIAGFHHTHAPLALAALKQGAYAVVEKPIATTNEQLEKLTKALEETKGNLFSGFHRRHSIFNNWIRQDLQVRNESDPISCHCIVYEAPQPSLYWYNWPNSGSPLLANGCHWIDHFLYLNNFSEPSATQVYVAKDETINVSVELKNGAFFTMTLTSFGSPYIGFRDYIELTRKDACVKITNYTDYTAQDKNGIIRQVRINKLNHYANMYRLISEKVNKGEKGDSLQSIVTSSRLILLLEEQVQKQLELRGI